MAYLRPSPIYWTTHAQLQKKSGATFDPSKIKMERSEGGEWINKYGSATPSTPTACNLEL